MLKVSYFPARVAHFVVPSPRLSHRKITLARRIREAGESLRRGQWDVFFGTELSGKQLGILSFGRIGRAVAKRATGFGLQIAAYDPFVPDEAIAKAGAQPQTLAEVVAGSDFLTLHLPGGEEPLLSAQHIESMPRGAGLVNAARGGLIDDAALVSALHDGRLSFAALDAFAAEEVVRFSGQSALQISGDGL